MTEEQTPIVVRPFEPADFARLSLLWGQVFPEDPPWNAPALLIAHKLTLQPQLLLVAVQDHELVGAVMAGFDGVRGWIHHLAVARESRRHGVATELVRAAEAGLVELGCGKVSLQVPATHTGVIAFYESLGFAGEERVILERRIGPTEND